MNVHAINKYPPRLYKQGRFLREDWTACSDIGKTSPQGVLTREEYLRVEGLHVAAVEGVARAVAPEVLRAHDVEYWETEGTRLGDLGLDDVIDGSPAPAEGEALFGQRLANVVRRCLREAAWLELVAEPRLLIHFGYDFRIFVASSLPLDSILDGIRASGLFVYDSKVALPTINSWLTRSRSDER